ncbi:MAG: hypothetical protein WCS27_15055 [Victivallaceae bacterium]
MNSKQKNQEQHTFESLCKDLWEIVVKHGNISPWKRDELSGEDEHFTEKQFEFLADFINAKLPEMLRELDDLKKAGAYSRWLDSWKTKYVFTNDIVSKLLDVKDLEEAHRRAKWLDEWKRKNDITVT